jgi:hypothetical protein
MNIKPKLTDAQKEIERLKKVIDNRIAEINKLRKVKDSNRSKKKHIIHGVKK